MQSKLVEILRHKGIGPKGSKQLNKTDIEQIPSLIGDPSCELTTKATLLTAIQLLDRTQEEELLISHLSSNLNLVPKELHFLLTKKASNYLESTILNLINREDLTEEEAIKSSETFLSNHTEAFFQAAYLEALRLKRETDLENQVFYKYFLKESKRTTINVDPIIEIGDSFDGVERNFNFNLFTATVLASLGYKVLVTGNKTVAPKKGITHHQILVEADKEPKISLKYAEMQLKSLGLCYIDQSVFHPEMWYKTEMRENMVKRPFLATFEKILSPIHSINGNYVITSYTHAHYKNANIEIFKTSPFIKKALNIKGLEGTIHPKANISIPVLFLENNEVKESNYIFKGQLEEVELEINSKNTLKLGLDFIVQNQDNIAKKYVVNSVLMILRSLELETDEKNIINKINQHIENKLVKNIWERFNSKI